MLDKVNLKILKAISDNARISFVELGKLVYLSPPAIAERVRRMEESGVILGYKPILNLEPVGINIEALVECQVHNAKERKLKAYLLELDEVIKIYNITGNTTFIVHVGVTRISELDRVIEGMIDYCDTNTKIIMNTPFNKALPQDIDKVLEASF